MQHLSYLIHFQKTLQKVPDSLSSVLDSFYSEIAEVTENTNSLSPTGSTVPQDSIVDMAVETTSQVNQEAVKKKKKKVSVFTKNNWKVLYWCICSGEASPRFNDEKEGGVPVGRKVEKRTKNLWRLDFVTTKNSCANRVKIGLLNFQSRPQISLFLVILFIYR